MLPFTRDKILKYLALLCCRTGCNLRYRHTIPPHRVFAFLIEIALSYMMISDFQVIPPAKNLSHLSLPIFLPRLLRHLALSFLMSSLLLVSYLRGDREESSLGRGRRQLSLSPVTCSLLSNLLGRLQPQLYLHIIPISHHYRINIALIKSSLDNGCCLSSSQFHQCLNDKSIHIWLVLLKPFQPLLKKSNTLTLGIGPSLSYIFNACNRTYPRRVIMREVCNILC